MLGSRQICMQGRQWVFGLALIFLLGISSHAAAQQTDAGPWGQCGGANNCPKASVCADAPWSGVTSCPAGFGCVRLDAFFWQCQAGATSTAVPAAAGASQQQGQQQGQSQQQQQGQQQSQMAALGSSKVGPYAQCGGRNGPCSSPPCNDVAWAECPVGFSCNRDNEYFW